VLSGFWNLSEAAPVDISRSYQRLEGLIQEFPRNANALIRPIEPWVCPMIKKCECFRSSYGRFVAAMLKSLNIESSHVLSFEVVFRLPDTTFTNFKIYKTTGLLSS